MLSVKQKRRLGGFTLIEVMIVLAISSLLAIVLVGAYNGQQRRARFADAVESVVADLDRVKAEVAAGYSTGSGNSGSRLFFGKAVVLAANNYQVQTLTSDFQDTVSGLQNASTLTSGNFAWGVTFTGADQSLSQIVFARNLADGQLKTYVLSASQSLTTASNYNAISAANKAFLHFQDRTGELRATVTVDPVSGHVSRTYDN